ncbi:threonine synthase [Phosphitispora sp. TUW77]|uniref:threonine synthase n=1 Tax=Phosphitispora sp. TUW77 TaxID=3152361 RepID=UPI003AB77B59
MKYVSTRGNFDSVNAAEAIKLGMVPPGGLFVPEGIPVIDSKKLISLAGKGYREIAREILGMFLTDYLPEEIDECIQKAYNDNNFDHPDMAPLYKLDNSSYVLELWHGPTAAFKDMALQIMPHFLSRAIEKLGVDRETVILVATSGDTGKAALEGFKNVPGIKIIVFYPYGGVSKVQELQMTTTDGDNTYVVAVRGNFDDCQNAVKQVFGDEAYNSFLAEKGYELSSANSINWGRLLPQIVYYFWAYLDLVGKKVVSQGDKVNFVVPTGNFGNILAGYYAFRMGLPINKLICASNENRVLTDFFATGTYDRNREFIKTVSPSMDILISSNLERFLFEMTGHDAGKISEWLGQLNREGQFQADENTRRETERILSAGYASEEETLETIRTVFEKYGYTVDTHTAVGVKVYSDYVRETGDRTVTVLDATANPFKFNRAVLEALKGEDAIAGKDEFEILRELEKITGMETHRGLKNLDSRPVKYDRVSDKGDIKKDIEEILGL